jgi:hypothetical protein
MGKDDLGGEAMEIVHNDLAARSCLPQYRAQSFLEIRASTLGKGEGEHSLVRLQQVNLAGGSVRQYLGLPAPRRRDN